MNINCIRNRRAGGESPLNFAISSYKSLRCAINTPISNCPWDCGVEMRNIYRATFDAVTYLSIHRTTKWCIRRNCKIRWRISCRSSICYAMNFHRSAVEKRRKSAFFSTFFTAFRWKFIVSQIGEREVILRIIIYLFPIHHFVVWSMLKYLIAREVLMGYVSKVYLLCEFLR